MNNIPENRGKSWNKIEDEKLLKLIKNGKTLNDIALEHKRTRGGIRSRLNVIARDLHENGMTIKDIQSKLKFVSTDDIQIAINYVRPKKHPKENPNCVLINEMKEINKTLQMLLMVEIKKNKLDYNELLAEINGNSLVNQSKFTHDTDDLIIESDGFNGKLIDEIIECMDDKIKLKAIRIKHNISRDIFYKKVRELRNK